MKLNEALLDRLSDWGSAMPHFQEEHARCGLIQAQGYVSGCRSADGVLLPGLGHDRQEAFDDLAKYTTWIFWFDDQFDETGSSPIDGDEIVTDEPRSVGFRLLHRTFDPYLHDSRERDLWLRSLNDLNDAMLQELELTEQRVDMTYQEYLENGVNSSTVPSLLASISAIYGLKLAKRTSDASDPAREMVRHVSLQGRLQNDFNSVERDLREGVKANAVLLQAGVTLEEARKLVINDLESHSQQLEAHASLLPQGDPLARLVRVMAPAQSMLYTGTVARYERPAPSASPESERISGPWSWIPETT